MDKKYDYIIIGNGLLGIHLGRMLKKENKSYIILEKSKNVGGRFCSRRFSSHNFNFGVRSFRWDSKFFKEEIEIGLNSKDLFLKNGEIHATDTFNIWTKKLSSELNVIQFEVSAVNRLSEDRVEVTNGKSVISGTNLVLTVPAPQAYSLLKSDKYSFLSKAKYSKDILYMCESENDDILHEKLTLINRIFLNNKYFYIFKVNFWSEDTRDEIKSYFDSQLNVVDSFAHKWRYSKLELGVDQKIVDENIHLLGDYYEGGIEGTYNSSSFFRQLVLSVNV